MSGVLRDPERAFHADALFQGGPVHAGAYEFDVEVEAHSHDFLEVAIIGEGHGYHLTAIRALALQKGDVIVLRPGAWHAFTRCESLTIANCCVAAPALGRELRWIREMPALERMLWTDPVAAGEHGVFVSRVTPTVADDAIEEVHRLSTDLHSKAHPHRVVGRLLTVLGTLADHLAVASASEPLSVNPVVSTAITYLEASPAEPWTVPELARLVNVDPSYLSRLFRRYVGLPPISMLARVRVERAAVLLSNTDLPVARVGAAVGWGDPTYFARRFSTLVGSTPSEYRKRSRACRGPA